MIAPPPARRPDGNRRLKNAEQEAVMFKILELDSQRSAAPTQVGEGFATWDDALAAIKRHLKRFKVSGRNPEGSYWWTRDDDGLRKCWISENKDGASGPARDPSK
jgi:hypothetical protein